MKYKTTFLLNDLNTYETDYIINANEDTETIQNAIYKAKEKYYELEEKNELPDFCYCEFDYISTLLCDQFDIEIIPIDPHNFLYY